MSERKVVNPCLEIFNVPGHEEEFLVTAPIPGKGLQSVNIKRSGQPEVYETVKALATNGFALFDAEEDVDEPARGFLLANGILIDEECVPVRPLFSCQLDDVPPKEIPQDSVLTISSSFRFEPVDFTQLNIWIYDRHLLPTQATVWIRHTFTGIETGYWLTEQQAEVLSCFEAGIEIKGTEFDESTKRKLYAAGIICSEESLKERNEVWAVKIERASSEFRKSGYAVIEGLIPDFQIKALRKFYTEYVHQGFMRHGDDFVENRSWEQNEPIARAFNLGFCNLVKVAVGEDVKPSYCYAASYNEGAILAPHVDREQCEFSVSLQIDFQPESADGKSPWALGVFTPKEEIGKRVVFDWEEIESQGGLKGAANDIFLKNGDGLFYEGRELIHYREKLKAGKSSTSIFLHYVREDFEGVLT